MLLRRQRFSFCFWDQRGGPSTTGIHKTFSAINHKPINIVSQLGFYISILRYFSDSYLTKWFFPPVFLGLHHLSQTNNERRCNESGLFPAAVSWLARADDAQSLDRSLKPSVKSSDVEAIWSEVSKAHLDLMILHQTSPQPNGVQHISGRSSTENNTTCILSIVLTSNSHMLW